eukprot:CAMPEP_0170212922 /NCGR_PEP_ID=MMETSP0116_2-20130129/6083_1 /TAXON_ID=400756 /ORGANISM="Durinskia baltica, Strain CSIRO CS-38" /LENGTH=189 /DNA_ID=CAMNT_0010463469 /DNA_START=293 /DNA_END=859 /DNA_ORIENTATION=+
MGQVVPRTTAVVVDGIADRAHLEEQCACAIAAGGRGEVQRAHAVSVLGVHASSVCQQKTANVFIAVFRSKHEWSHAHAAARAPVADQRVCILGVSPSDSRHGLRVSTYAPSLIQCSIISKEPHRVALSSAWLSCPSEGSGAPQPAASAKASLTRTHPAFAILPFSGSHQQRAPAPMADSQHAGNAAHAG